MSIGANLISIVEIRPERQKAVSKLQRGSERPLWMYDRNHWFYARCGNLSTISMSSKAFTSLIWYSFFLDVSNKSNERFSWCSSGSLRQ